MPFAAIDSLPTARLLVRPVERADLADLLAVNGDPEVTRYLPYATWQSMDDAAAWLARMADLAATGTGQQLVVVERGDGRTVGTVLLFRHEPGSARMEVGFVLGRAHWGQGIMREALRAVCAHAFGPMGIRRLEAEVNPANLASNALLQRVGFTLEGRLRQRWVAKGVTYDTNFYGCLGEEWQRRVAGQ